SCHLYLSTKRLNVFIRPLIKASMLVIDLFFHIKKLAYVEYVYMHIVHIKEVHKGFTLENFVFLSDWQCIVCMRIFKCNFEGTWTIFGKILLCTLHIRTEFTTR